MASNPFQTSPYSDADFTSSPPAEIKSPPPVSRGLAPTRDYIIQRAKELDVDPTLALSIWNQESSSGRNPSTSTKGAMLDFQVMPGTYRAMMGTSDGMDDRFKNVEAGLRYLSYGQKKLGTRDPEILAAGYHSGMDRKSLKAGIIPDTNDGSISTRDYAASVAGRLRKSGGKATSASVDDEFSDTPVTPSLSDSEFSDTPVMPSIGPSAAAGKEPDAQQKALDDAPLWDYFKSKGVTGWDSMQQSLDVARWAVGGVDDATMAEQLAKKMQADSQRQKTTDEKENDAAWRRVSDAKGVVDTTKEAFKAIGTSITNPKATLGEIVEQGSNSIPTMAAGIGGAGAGAVAGGVGAIPGAIGGAIVGGRAGMVAGTTAIEGAGQIQELISSRLQEQKQEPTAQNILALLGSPEFKAEARKQGLAKGLTVAAVDQFTMGLGGKIATAPARKAASKALEEQGMDMATRAARNEALASPAGRVALQAAKPAVGSRVGAGAAAVGVDATGEVVGDYAGSVAADGKGDIGDSLRGGLMSVGQSGVSVAVGATIESAKLAAAQAKAAIQPTISAPSTAPGPLARAAENAAVGEERVTVTAPDGQVSGKVAGKTADGSAVQIVGDDGQVYTFATGAEGIKITPEAPNTPLSNALEVAAEGLTEVAPVEAVATEPKPTAEPAPDVASPALVAPAAPTVEPAPEPVKTIADMNDDELKARRAYIVQQAKSNGGWGSMLVKERRLVDKEMDARAAKVQTPKAEDFTDVAPTANESVAQATPAGEAAARLPKELAGAKPRYNYGNKGFDLNFSSDVDRSAYIAAQEKPSKRDAEYLKHAMDATGMSEAEVRAHGAQVREAIKAMAKDGKPGTLKVPEVARGGVTVSQPAPTGGAPEVGAGVSQPTQVAPNQKAMDRIARGTAYFGSKPKAVDWIANNDLGATHEVVKHESGANRWDVRAKPISVTEEQTNGTDTNTSGKPASTEKVVSSQEAKPAESAPVQPDAAQEEVAAKQWVDLTPWAKRNVLREAGVSLPDRVQWERISEANKAKLTPAILKELAPANAAAPVADVSQNVPENDTSQERVAETAKSKQDDPFAKNKVFTSDAVEKARARMKSKLGQLNSGIDPELMMDGMTIAGAYLESGVRSFSAYAKAMSEDFGDKIKPYLLSFYEAARNYPGLDTEGMTPVAEAQAEHAKMLGAADLTETKEAIGEVAPKPAKRTKKTGSAGDTTLTQDWGVDHIDGYGDDLRETGNTVKDAFLKDARDYLKAAGALLQDRGFVAIPDDKGRPRKAVNVNESGMATSGEVSLTLYNPEIGSGIYAKIGGGSLRGVAPSTTSGVQIMFRASTKEDPYGARGVNRWAPVDMSAADFAGMLEKEARRYGTEKPNEPAQLDQSGARELEGKQPDAVQGTEPQREAGDDAQGSGGTDIFGGVGAGSERPQPAGRLGDDAREVPAAASRERAGRGGEPGSQPVQRSERASKRDPSQGRETGNQPSLIPESGNRSQDRADGFVITEDDAIGEGGQKTKFKQNVAAIRLLKELETTGRPATRAEQAVLAKYVGWGGIPQAFYRDNNEVSKGWEKEAAELKEVMTAEELAAAAASTRNAHYTSPEIVSAVWDAAKHFGFQGGRVLEPSVGVGNFFGLMPTALRSASQLTGVELDHITGGIAKQLYPQANIAAPVGFQNFSAPDDYFDLAIGNPPFGREGIYDPTRKKISGFSIHNYFFGKSIDTVRPNGVLAMVVTNRLLDSTGDKARKYIADRAEFLGAVRLPNDAFAKNAGTQVTTDIVFLRKLKEGEQPTGQRWMDVREYKGKDGNTVPLNEYFVRNPNMMLGDFGQYGSMYSAEDAALVARPGQDTPALLQAAVAKLPKGFMDGPTAEPVRETIEPMHDVSHVKIGSIFEQDGQIFERREDLLGKQQAAPVVFANDKAKERVTGMIGVRDALIEVRGLQLQENMPEANLAAARAALNEQYDAFVKANGPLNADANKRLMRDDPTWPQIAALEDNFDKGVTVAVAKTTGEKARPPSAKKAAIFSKRTQAPYKAPEKATSAKDAMVSSLAERGRVDLDYMSSLYGKSPEAIAKELTGLIFKNPAGGWESRDQYLSGNVKKKLAQAIDAAKADPSLKANVDALKAVQPADIEAVDIDVKTGAHWIPADVMETFVEKISEGTNSKAIYNPVSALWTLSVERSSQAANTQWSTDRASLRNVLEAAANQKQITVFDKHEDGSRTLNEAATTAANEKVERVKNEWKSWLWADDARRVRLSRIYNDTFNTDVQRDYDGSHLSFPSKVGDDIITLRPHQANAVWRMVQSGTTLLDHVVGAGKTYTMVAGIMEMRRMGMAKKPMLVVPNHLVGQWAEDFMRLYPGANILAATKKDFETENRKKLFARIATGDWDAVIVAHSSFGKVEVEPEFQADFIKQQIDDMDTSIVSLREAEGKGSRNVKQIEKQKASLKEKLKKLFDTGSKDDNLHFGELGVDALLLDEAHEFKNLGFSTGMQRVAGLGNPAGSNKAADMFMKVQATLQRTGGKNVVFATGTPISNTMAEMYTMQRFLDYGTLKDQGIAHFDAWAKTFGEVVTDWELSPSGQYKMNSRFAKFVNMPELMQRYGSFADVINRDDINRQLAAQGKKLPVPKVAGGKPENTVVERSSDQAQYIGIPTVDENGVEQYPEHSLVYRAENLPKGPAQKGADNMLKIMSDARKAALDMRLIDPSYGDNPGSKVNVAADNIKATYDKWAKEKGTQLVFSDLSTPKGAVAKEAAAIRELIKLAEEGDNAAQTKLDAMSPDELLALDSKFSVYDDLKAKLIAKGIPENEIAFIHDAGTDLQKAELFAKVRSGRVRVLLGSTSKMGAGMNVQERLVALHHLDAPWRPSDLEQREGRIIRQGNSLYDANPENFEVAIKRYATKQTLDSRMWQTIEAKARFIEQVRKGTGEREVEDVAGEASNSAEMKAASSGNPMILEEMSLRQAIRKLENQSSEHNREQFRIRDRIRMSGDMARANDAKAAELHADAPKAPKEFTATIGNQTFDKPKEAGEAILGAVDAILKAKEDTREIGSYGGFRLILDNSSNKSGIVVDITIKGEGEYQVTADPGSDPTGLGQRMRNAVRDLAEMAQNKRDEAQRMRADIPKLEAQIKPWGQESELAEAKKRHADVIEQLKPKKKVEAAKTDAEAPAFSRAEDAATPAEQVAMVEGAVKRVEQVVANQTQGWASNVPVIVVADMNDPRIPRSIREDDARLHALAASRGKTLGQVRGFWHENKIYLVASQLATDMDASRVLFHEGLGHFGLRGLFGEGLNAVLSQIVALRKADVIAKANSYELNVENEQDMLHAAEEVLASMAETTPTIGFVRRAVAAIRTWLRKNVPGFANMKLSDAEIIEQFILPARAFVEQGASPLNDVKARPNKPSMDSLKADSKAITNFLESHSARPEPKGLFNIPSSVMAHVLNVTNNDEILGAIVRSIPVDVMNFLRSEKLSPKDVLSDKPMLKDMFSVNREPSVSLGIDKTISAALMRSVAIAATEISSLAGGPLESSSASFARARDSVFSAHSNSNGVVNKKDVTRNESFLRWFGDSKVVDADGKPLVVYHGTNAKFGRFKEDSFFTPTESAAEKYGKNVVPVYLSFQNPKVVDYKGREDNTKNEDIEDAKTEGYDSLIIRNADDGWNVGDQYIAFNPAQIKSAIGNNGNFDPSKPDIRFSRAKPAVPTGLTPPEQGLLRRVQATIQNNMNRVRQVQDRITEITGQPIAERSDYYGAETNRPGRIAARLEDARNKLTQPLMAGLAKSGHTAEELGELLHAMHAEERNEAIARINPAMPDGGSGMMTADANAILKKYATNKTLHKLADQARAISKATLDLKRAYGRIEAEEFDALTAAYRNYVPLKGDGEFGPKVKRAMGHEEREELILDNIARDYDQAVVTGEKNLARQSLLSMVLENPDPELWSVGVPPRGRYIAGKVFSIMRAGEEVATFTSGSQVAAFLEAKGPQAGQYEVVDSSGERVQEFVKPLQDNEVMVYVDGKPVRIQIKDEQLARQLRPLNQGQMNPILEYMRGVNRYLSKIYTGYNPSFIIRNTARDAMTGTINILGNEGAGTAMKAWANYPASMKALGIYAATGKPPTGEAGRMLEEYRQHGGKTGASYMSDLEEQGKTLQRMFEDAYGARGYLAAGKPTKAAMVAGRKIVGGMAHVIEVMNQATENGLRLALYMAMRNQGKSAGEAAQAAKSVTVDFDRKGTMTPALSAIFLFFNPAVQGTSNALKTLFKGAKKEQAWMALGALAALGAYAAGQGMDDDKDRWLGEGWETRAKNFMLNIGGHTIKVPLSMEFAPFYALGVAMAEAKRNSVSKMAAAGHIVSSFIDAYFPLQGAYMPESDNHGADAAMAGVPTLLKPGVQIAFNRNSFGSQIVPENEFTKDRPDNLKMFRGTKGSVYDAAAQGIAKGGELFGAGRFENDITKVSPETLKMLWRTYTGGLGQFVTDSAGLANVASQDANGVEASDVPVLKDFLKTNDVKAIRGRFYDLTKDARAVSEEFKQAKKAGDDEAMTDIENRPGKAELLGLDRMIKATTKAAAGIRDEMLDINQDKTLSLTEKRAQLKALEKEEEAVYRDAIQAFK